MGRMIGIDLGTTNCCVAVLQGGSPAVIHTRQGTRTMPSVVAFGDGNEEMVGAAAQRQAVTNPHRTVFGAKRLMGRKFGDAALERWKTTVPYEIVGAPNGDAWVRTRDADYSPPEISAVLLGEIKSIAEDYLGEAVTDAVVTVPAYFNDTQRQATKDAGRIAGLNVRHILNEPTAAALGYGVEKATDQTLAIFDLGGGTFDITIMRSRQGLFQVLATNGDTFLGGDDFDHLLVEHLLEHFKEENDVDLHDDPVALQRLKEAAETAKKELSSTLTTAINMPFISTGPNGPMHLRLDDLERVTFEQLTQSLIDRLEAPCRQAMADAGLEPEALDQVLLVGGMTRMPAVQQKVEEIFGQAAAKDVNPDEIVAIGAALQCGILSGELDEIVLLDVTPHSLGVRVRGDRMSRIIDKNTTIPTSENKRFTTTEDDQEFVEIQVYQGEDDNVTRNTPLGRFKLGDLPKGPRGTLQVEVTFLLDADGVLNVTATEASTGKESSVKISPSSGLARSQVDEILEKRGTSQPLSDSA